MLTHPHIYHVEDLRDVYRSFARYLCANRSGEFSFLDCDYDDIIGPLLDYIATYGFTPSDDFYYGEIYDIEDSLPREILSGIARSSGLNNNDIIYLMSLLANRTNNIPEVLMERYMGITGKDCRVAVKKVSTANWMFYLEKN